VSAGKRWRGGWLAAAALAAAVSGAALFPGGRSLAVAAGEPGLAGHAAVWITVKGEPRPPGEPAPWTVALINPGPLSLYEVRLEACVSPEWRIYEASVPAWEEEAGGDGRCRTLPLGTLAGKSRRELEVLLVFWDGGWRAGQAAGFFVPAASGEYGYLDLRVTAAERPGAGRKLVHAARVPLEVEEDPLLIPAAPVSGRVFVDLDRSGLPERGEPAASGAVVVADGLEAAAANRRGEYRLDGPQPPRVIWAESERGDPVPLSLSPARVWAAGGRVDLPVAPGDPQDAGAASGEAGGGSRGRALLWVRAGPGSSPEDAGAGLRASWQRPGLAAAFRIDAGFPEVAAGASGGAFPAAWHRDVSLALRFHQGGLRLEADHESGLARTVRRGALRPSKPVESASRLQLSAAVDARPARERAAAEPAERGTAFPGAPGEAGPVPERWEFSAELGRARGDVWQCTLRLLGASHTAGGSRLGVEIFETSHRRAEHSGVKQDQARRLTLEVDGGLALGEAALPFHAELVRGTKRRLSPSCGLSPFEGWRWQALAALPPVPGLGAVEWNGMAWQQARKTASGGRETVWRRAHELALASDPLALGPGIFHAVAAVQWQDVPAPEEGTATKARLGGRIQGRLWDRHDLRLEIGALPLAKVETPSHLPRGDRRLALRWRVTRGPVRPWVAYEAYAPQGTPEEPLVRAHEYGVWIRRPVPVPWSGQRLDASLWVSRRTEPDDVDDELRLSLRAGASALRLEWKGTAARSAAEGGDEDESDESVAGGMPPAPERVVMGRYEKIDWSLSLDRSGAAGTREWSLRLEGKEQPDAAELSASVLIGGRWGEPQAAPGPAGSKNRWAGRWQAGAGRGLARRHGAGEAFVSGVFRLVVERGPWGLEGAVSGKWAAYDAGLVHAAYHGKVTREIGGDWSAAMSLGRELSGGSPADRLGLGVAKRLGRGIALEAGLVWERSRGPASRFGPPRAVVMLAAPYIW